MAARLIHVVRHAEAGERRRWHLDDDLRPLSEAGCGQAQRLVGQLGTAPATVLSSPSIRCIATVLPLARAHGVPLTTRAELYEGADAGAMLELLIAQPSPAVACTHGDLLSGLIGALIDAGIALPSLQAEKGSTWTLEVVEGSVRSARYAPPP